MYVQQKDVESIKNIPVDSDESQITQTDKNILSFLFPEEQTVINKNNLNSINNGQFTESVSYANGQVLSGGPIDTKGISPNRHTNFLKILLFLFIFSILFLPSPLFVFDKISDNKNIHLALKIVILFIFYLYLYKF